jgi:hypothetical protein
MIIFGGSKMSNIIGEQIIDSDEPIRIRSWQEINETGEHKKPLNERVDAMTYVKPFPIKEIDLLTIKRFIKFCRFNSKNDWGIGLKILLDYVEGDAKSIMLFDKMMRIESEIEGVKAEIQDFKKSDERTEKKTFGGMKDGK